MNPRTRKAIEVILHVIDSQAQCSTKLGNAYAELKDAFEKDTPETEGSTAAAECLIPNKRQDVLDVLVYRNVLPHDFRLTESYVGKTMKIERSKIVKAVGVRTANVYSLAPIKDGELAFRGRKLDPRYKTGRRGHRFCVDLFLDGGTVYTQDTDTKKEAEAIKTKWLEKGIK